LHAHSSTSLLSPSKKERYSSFKTGQKTLIVFVAAFASTFSPLSSNIYYPAINSIAHDLKVTPAMMNLTITAYMVLQGIVPSFMGNLSDTAGRRPVYILCFGIYLISNVGLALQRDYWSLLTFRAVQSTGISATISLSNAVAADTVTSAERGTYLGIASLGSLLGPTLGPTLGGLITKQWGWHGIFWLLATLSGCMFVLITLLFPETCRQVVGDGSIPPPKWNRSVLNVLADRRKRREGLDVDDELNHRGRKSRKPIQFPNPLTTVRLIFELPTSLLLISNGVGYASYYAVTSSVPAMFAEIYGLDVVQLGLSYIPISLGTICSAVTTSWIIDYNFSRLAAQNGGMPSIVNGRQDLGNFPVERARLQIAIPAAITAAVTISVYGWCLHHEAPLRVSIALLFFFGYFMTVSSNVLNVLIVDLNYEIPGTATAANNLVRGSIGAATTGIIIPLIGLVGRGVGFSIIAGIWIAVTPFSLIAYRRGLEWRQKRDARKNEDVEN
ncbi:citrate synthase, partial [Aureobasidium pullulans]